MLEFDKPFTKLFSSTEFIVTKLEPYNCAILSPSFHVVEKFEM